MRVANSQVQTSFTDFSLFQHYTTIRLDFVSHNYFSFIYYTLSNIYVNMIVFFCNRCAIQSKFDVCSNSSYIPGTAILDAQGTSLPLWANTFMLLAFLLVFRVLGYIVLRYFRRPKWSDYWQKGCEFVEYMERIKYKIKWTGEIIKSKTNKSGCVILKNCCIFTIHLSLIHI